MKLKDRYRILWLTIFSIAMAFLETAVVVYLRALFYSEGFDFPINPIEDSIITLTELLREAATIIMLLGIAYLYGKNFITRFAAFLFSFAVWDIFYYVFLKVLIDWPETLFTWDVLFLLPVTWVSPVLAPIVVSITMILYASVFWKADKTLRYSKIKTKEWLIILLGCVLILFSFIKGPSSYLIDNNAFSEAFNINSDTLFSLMQEYIPIHFDWWIFIIGELFLILGIGIYGRSLIRK